MVDSRRVWTGRTNAWLAIAILVCLCGLNSHQACAETNPRTNPEFHSKYGEREPIVHGIAAVTRWDSPFRFFGDGEEFSVRSSLEACEKQIRDVLRAYPPEKPLPLVVEVSPDLDAASICNDLNSLANDALIEDVTVTSPTNRLPRLREPEIRIRVGHQHSDSKHLATTTAQIMVNRQTIVRNATGIAFDRGGALINSAIAGLFCFFACFGAAISVHRDGIQMRRTLILTAAFFASGVVVQILLLRGLASIAPQPGSPVLPVLCWIAAVGYGTFLIPAALTWRMVSAAQRFSPDFWWEGAESWVAPSATLAACSVLFLSLQALYPDEFVVPVASLVAAAALAHFCAVHLQGRISSSRAAWAALAILPATWSLGVARFSTSLVGVTGGVSLLLIFALRNSILVARPSGQSESESLSSGTSLAPLRFRIPPVRGLVQAIGEQWQSTCASFHLVRGEPGVIAAALDQTVREARQEYPDLEVLELRGAPDDQPLSTWLDAWNRLDPEFDLEQLAGLWNQVPIAGLAGAGQMISSTMQFQLPQRNVFSRLEDRVMRLLASRACLLVIRDADQLDESSIRLLFRLQERLTSMNVRLTLVADHELDRDGKSFQFDQVHDVPSLRDQQIEEQLAAQFQLERRSARIIVAALPRADAASPDRSKLDDLRLLMSHLDQIGAFESTEVRRLKRQFFTGHSIPLPAVLSQSIAERLKSLSQRQRFILTAVACHGLRSDVRELAGCLDESRLAVVAQLHALTLTGLITEDEDEFHYQFCSTSVFEAVCDWLQIRSWDAAVTGSNLQRELHYRMFRCLSVDQEQANVTRLARHATAAGNRTADKAVQLNVMAAHQALQSYSFSLAEVHLRAAAVCARRCHRPFDLDRELLSVRMEKSHVSQTQLVETAASAWTHTKNCREGAFLLKVARCCYDAAKVAAGEESAQLKRACAHLARRVASDPSSSAALRAEGLQFLGLGYSQSPDALRYLRRSVAALSQPANHHEQNLLARLLCSLADEIVRQQGDFCEARDHYQRSLEMRRSLPVKDDNGIARVYGGLGRTEYFLNNFPAAAGWFEKDLELATRLGDQRSVAQMHTWIGCCSVHQGQAHAACRHFMRSLDLCRLDGDRVHALVGLVVATYRDHNRAEFERALTALAETAATTGNLRQLVRHNPLSGEFATTILQGDRAAIPRKLVSVAAAVNQPRRSANAENPGRAA